MPLRAAYFLLLPITITNWTEMRDIMIHNTIGLYYNRGNNQQGRASPPSSTIAPTAATFPLPHFLLAFRLHLHLHLHSLLRPQITTNKQINS